MSGEKEILDVEIQPSAWEKFSRFMYEPDGNKVIGRNASSWGKLILFYLIYYGCLAGFWAIMMVGFISTMSKEYPTVQGMGAPIKENPGMGFRPQPDKLKTVIRFAQGDNKTYTSYIQDIETYLQEYNDTQGHNCTDGRPADFNPLTDFCRFDINEALTERCSPRNDYGFAEGEPCVLIKMNKVYGWEPEPYLPGSEKFPEADGRHIILTCEGENAPDVDNIGKVEFSPASGISVEYFPYMTNADYQAPFVFARFAHIEIGMLVQVSCKAWAVGISHHKYDRAGSVHFELLVD